MYITCHSIQIIFGCPPKDLLFALLFLMAVENDAGVMLQTSEVMRIILDTEMQNEGCQLGGVGNIDNEDEFPNPNRGNGSFQLGLNLPHGNEDSGSEQNSFLQMFYDHYVPWFVAPLQYSTLVCRSAVPYSLPGKSSSNFATLQECLKNAPKDQFQLVAPSALRLSFSLELLSFCVKAHCFR